MASDRLRIAQIAPLAERVPPHQYGGTERVVSALTEELVRRGHDVTLFASGDSRTAARLVATVPQGLRPLPGITMPRDLYPAQLAQLTQVYARAGEFDLIHSHVDYFAFPFACIAPTPTLHTLHGQLDFLTLPVLYETYPEAMLCSVSRSQQTPLPGANWVGNVYNGIPLDHLPPGDGRGGYFAFLGRISPNKGIREAIAIAKRTGIPLKIAAKVDDDHPEYIGLVRDELDGRLIEWVGEIGDADKGAFLGEARALLFPIQWPEPFGLATIEAMACGTPVLATPLGAVPEVVADGVTGFIRASVDGLVAAVPLLNTIDRAACRRHVECHFSAAAMTTAYETIYRRLIETHAAL